jgi:hypothetical protein
MAVARCDADDSRGARALVVAALDVSDEQTSTNGADAPAAETYARFGARIGKSARTVRTLVHDGTIPGDAVIGEGRGRRVVVERALAALTSAAPRKREEQAGEDYVARRRARLRLASGGSP